MADLYIDDDDFQPYNTKIAEVDSALETKLGDIITQIYKACTGIEMGDFHNNLVSYAVQLSTMKEQLNEFTTRMQTNSTDFLNAMKRVDEESII